LGATSIAPSFWLAPEWELFFLGDIFMAKYDGTIIQGRSDDIVEFDGEIVEEAYTGEDDKCFLCFSDGTTCLFEYNSLGVWKIFLMSKGSLFDRIEVCDCEDDGTDVLYIRKGLKWVTCAEDIRIHKISIT
jgi:hypothetical protein